MQGGANAVKVEWFSAKGGSASGRSDCIYVVKNLMRHKIPVMGHIGLTPQTAHLLGGFKVQGKDKDSAAKLIEQAKILEDLGAFSLVLECIPYQLARFITKEIKIPTIGIGAGKFCDGQVLVLYDFIGLYQGFRTKFVRLYGDFHAGLKEATARFIKDIRRGKFPNKNESFSMKNAEWRKLSAAFNTK
jgi:3-methyl-2-oxobutanoate hydroxymethyltransferase